MVTLEAAPRFAPHCFIRFGMMTFEGLIPSSRATYTSGMVTTILPLARPSSSLAIASAMRSKALSRIGLSSPASTRRASSDRSAPTASSSSQLRYQASRRSFEFVLQTIDQFCARISER